VTRGASAVLQLQLITLIHIIIQAVYGYALILVLAPMTPVIPSYGCTAPMSNVTEPTGPRRATRRTPTYQFTHGRLLSREL
jgi:hypothetical protein